MMSGTFKTEVSVPELVSASEFVQQLWGVVGLIVFLGGGLSLRQNLGPLLSWLALRAPAWVLLLGGAIIFVGSLIPTASYEQLSWLGLRGEVWMTGVLAVLLVVILVLPRLVLGPPTDGQEPQESKQLPEGWGHALVIKDNTSLREGTGLRDTFFREGDEIYGYWLSGLVAQELAEVDKLVSLRTVILPDPTKKQWIEGIARSLVEDPDSLVNQIEEATAKLREMGVPKVLWHDGGPYTGVALTFGNPLREDGWVNVNPNLTRPDPRRHGAMFRVEKKGNEDSFNTLWKSFQRIERESRPAPVLRVADVIVHPAEYRESPDSPVADESTFVHVLIENAGPVQLKECGARILRMRNPDGTEYPFSPKLRLHRSGGEKPQTVTISSHSREPFDLVRAMKGQPKFELFSKDPIPFGIPNDFFDKPGRYEFDLEVIGEDAPTSHQIVRLEWNGKWDQMKPTLQEGDS